MLHLLRRFPRNEADPANADSPWSASAGLLMLRIMANNPAWAQSPDKVATPVPKKPS
jgi:hypothetical protein